MRRLLEAALADGEWHPIRSLLERAAPAIRPEIAIRRVVDCPNQSLDERLLNGRRRAIRDMAERNGWEGRGEGFDREIRQQPGAHRADVKAPEEEVRQVEWSKGANRYLAWLKDRNSLAEQEIVPVRTRAEALASERGSQFVTSKDLGEAWREIGRGRVEANKERRKR